jgi:uncharacterized membrane protein
MIVDVEAVNVWQFLHVACMFFAVSIFVGQGMLEGVVARSGDVRGLRRVLKAEDRFAPVGGGLFLLGIVFGFVTAIVGGYHLTQTWLLIGYVLAGIILVNAFLYHIPTNHKLAALAETSPDEPSAELRATIDDPIGRIMNVVDGVAWLAIIYVMVAKPFDLAEDARAKRCLIRFR